MSLKTYILSCKTYFDRTCNKSFFDKVKMFIFWQKTHKFDLFVYIQFFGARHCTLGNKDSMINSDER